MKQKLERVIDHYDKVFKNEFTKITELVGNSKEVDNTKDFVDAMITILIRNSLRFLDAIGSNEDDLINNMQMYIKSIVAASGGEAKILRVYKGDK